MGLNRWQHQGLFGETFIRALASAAGLIVTRVDLDVTGEDFTITGKGVLAGKRHPKIDMQIKSWSNPAERGRRLGLSSAGRAFQRVGRCGLFVAAVSYCGNRTEGARPVCVAEPERLLLNHAAYWVSLQDKACIDPAARTMVTVRVPKANLVTTEVLRSPPARPRAGGGGTVCRGRPRSGR